LVDGSKITSGEKRFCQNYYEYNNYCITPLLNEITNECYGDQNTCNYKYKDINNQTLTMQLQCICNSQLPNRMFCPIISDNDEYKQLVPAIKSWYEDYSVKKHTVLRNYYSYDIKVKVLKFENPILLNADSCYLGKTASSTYLSFKYLSVLLLVLSLFNS